MVLKLAILTLPVLAWFENDVKEYGTQASCSPPSSSGSFENDVKEYGTQAQFNQLMGYTVFENDVKEYGTQARSLRPRPGRCLRMM